MNVSDITRRACLLNLAGGAFVLAQAPSGGSAGTWTCPMDPDVQMPAPGKCPRCGMTLVEHLPDRAEARLEVMHPGALVPHRTVTLTLRMLNGQTNAPLTQFQIVHEKLVHLFLVHESLGFFAHVHPEPRKDGSFDLPVEFPYGGMYRLLADYYPAGYLPQLSLATLYVQGQSPVSDLKPSLVPSKATNLTAALQLEPAALLAGLQSQLTYTLDPPEGLELYLGVWGHMLVASADLVDLIHVHPFLQREASLQFNVIFPRPGLYRIWTQFQRRGEVNTVCFTVPVAKL